MVRSSTWTHRSPSWWLVAFGLIMAHAVSPCWDASAQAVDRQAVDRQATPSPQLSRGGAKEAKQDRIHEDFVVDTSDGVRIRGRFFGGGRSKTTIPVMIVHEFGGQGSSYYPLATLLQDRRNGGCAVIVPDLRGHGQSTRQLRDGDITELDSRDLRRDDAQSIARRDLPRVKKFLIEQNNLGKLNIEALCVIAVETGAVYALQWIQRDWDRKQLVGYRRGRDTKAFVLVSPAIRHQRVTLLEPLRHPIVRSELAALLIYGAGDTNAASAARRIHSALRRYHPSKFATIEDEEQDRDLFVRELDTSLSGSDLVNQNGLNVSAMIATFVDARLVNHADRYPWALREDPFRPDD